MFGGKRFLKIPPLNVIKILLIDGAEYIESYVVKLLVKKGYKVVVIDNLSIEQREAVIYRKLEMVNLKEKEKLSELIKKFKPYVVIHFAAPIEVEESVKNPAKYYRNNTVNTLDLLESMIENDIKFFIFSSTAAVYGIPEEIPIKEDAPLRPINPYRKSKAFAKENVKRLRFGLRA